MLRINDKISFFPTTYAIYLYLINNGFSWDSEVEIRDALFDESILTNTYTLVDFLGILNLTEYLSCYKKGELIMLKLNECYTIIKYKLQQKIEERWVYNTKLRLGLKSIIIDLEFNQVPKISKGTYDILLNYFAEGVLRDEIIELTEILLNIKILSIDYNNKLACAILIEQLNYITLKGE